MQLTPQKIAAIKAIADDVRGEPNTRRIAQAKLEKYRRSNPDLFHEADIQKQFHGDPRNNPPNPRTQPRQDYARWRFMDIGSWATSAKGNPTIADGEHRITVFKNKKGEWSWSRVLISGDASVVFQHGFDTIRQAQEAAWTSLQNL